MNGVGPATPGYVLRSAPPSNPAPVGPRTLVVPGSTGDHAAAVHEARTVARPNLAAVHRGRGTCTCNFLQRTVHLEPGVSIPVNAVFIHVPHGTGWTAAGYDTGVLTTLREDDAAAWHRNLANFSCPAKPAVGREVAWHGGYLRSALTQCGFNNESVLDQGTAYRYGSGGNGFEGAACDPLQHALPRLHMAPGKVAPGIRCPRPSPSPRGPLRQRHDRAHARQGQGWDGEQMSTRKCGNPRARTWSRTQARTCALCSTCRRGACRTS